MIPAILNPTSCRRRGLHLLAVASLPLVAVVLAACGVGNTTQAEPSGATSVGTSSAEPVAKEIFADDFESGSLDPARWSTPEHPELIRVADGALNLQVTPADTANGLEDRVEAKLPSAVREVSIIISVPEYGTSGPGGGALRVVEQSGRDHQIVFGPSSGKLEAAALVCEKSVCGSYEDYVSPADIVTFEKGQQLQLRVVASGQGLGFYIAERLVASTAASGEPVLTGFRIELYGADGEEWHITVDSVRAVA